VEETEDQGRKGKTKTFMRHSDGTLHLLQTVSLVMEFIPSLHYVCLVFFCEPVRSAGLGYAVV
jgi:hypothetical protein